MEPYGITFCLLAALTILDLYLPAHISRLPIGIACATSLALISGLRWETGNDWLNYYENFNFATSLRYNQTEFEIGYRGLVVFCRLAGLSYTGFLILSSLIANASFVFVFSRIGSVALLSLMYFSSYFLGNMGTQRQTLAAAFVAVAIMAIASRRRITGIALIGLATTFHVSAVIGLVALVTPRRSPSLIIAAVVGVFAVLIALFLRSYAPTLIGMIPGGGFVSGKVIAYVINDTASAAAPENIALATFKRLIFGGMFLWLCRNPLQSTENFILNLYLASILLFFLFIEIVPILALRIGQYFTIFENYLIIVATANMTQRYWREACASVLIIFSAMRLYWSITGYESQLFVPYKSSVSERDYQRFIY